MLFVALFCSFDWENNIWNRTKTVGCGTVPRAKKYVLQKRPSKFFFCFAFIISLHCSFIKNFYVASKSTILCLSNGTSCTKFRSLVFEYYNKTFYQPPVTHRLRGDESHYTCRSARRAARRNLRLTRKPRLLYEMISYTIYNGLTIILYVFLLYLLILFHHPLLWFPGPLSAYAPSDDRMDGRGRDGRLEGQGMEGMEGEGIEGGGIEGEGIEG